MSLANVFEKAAISSDSERCPSAELERRLQRRVEPVAGRIGEIGRDVLPASRPSITGGGAQFAPLEASRPSQTAAAMPERVVGRRMAAA